MRRFKIPVSGVFEVELAEPNEYLGVAEALLVAAKFEGQTFKLRVTPDGPSVRVRFTASPDGAAVPDAP